MSLISRQEIAILNEYCDYVNNLFDEACLKEGKVGGLLLEKFTVKNFAEAIDKLQNLENLVPDQMVYTLAAVQRAVSETKRDYAKLIRKQLSKTSFAKSVAKISSLIEAISDSIGELNAILKSEQLRNKLNARMGSPNSPPNGDKLGEILDDESKEILQARIEAAFDQPSTFFAKMNKSMFPEAWGWHGLTDRKLFYDLMQLDQDSTLKIAGGGLTAQINATIPASVVAQAQAVTGTTPSSSAPAATSPSTSSAASQTSGPGSSPAQKQKRKKKSSVQGSAPGKVSLKLIFKKMGIDNPTPDQIASLADTLVADLGVEQLKLEIARSQDDELILEHWRHLAGIPRSSKQ